MKKEIESTISATVLKVPIADLLVASRGRAGSASLLEWKAGWVRLVRPPAGLGLRRVRTRACSSLLPRHTLHLNVDIDTGP